MPVDFEVILVGEEHVVIYTTTEPWTAAQFTAPYSEDNSARDDVTHRPWILDFSKITKAPMQLFNTVRRKDAPMLLHPNSDAYIVTPPGWLRSLALKFQSIYKAPGYQRLIVTSRTEAINMILAAQKAKALAEAKAAKRVKVKV